MNLAVASRGHHELTSKILLLFVICQIGTGQDCLRPAPNEGRQIPFQDEQDLPRLPRNTLALIPDYQFYCCGDITDWQAYVAPLDDDDYHYMYTLALYIWRPSTDDPNCFNLVGTVPLEGSENYVSVQPGDVLGYYQGVSTSEEPNPNGEGILLDTSIDDVTVLFQTGGNSVTTSTLCIHGDSGNGILSSVTMAAPAISVELSTSSCISPTTTDQNTPTSKPSQSTSVIDRKTPASKPSQSTSATDLNTLTSESSQSTSVTDQNTQPSQSTSATDQHSISTSLPPPPPPSEKNLKLLSLLMVVAVLVVTLVTLGGVLALHRRKRAKSKVGDGNNIDNASVSTATSHIYATEYSPASHLEGLEMTDNTAYAHNISTAANKSYATSHVYSSCMKFQMKENTAYVHSDISTATNESYVATNIVTSANPAYSKSMLKSLDDTETSNLAEVEYSYPTNTNLMMVKEDSTC